MATSVGDSVILPKATMLALAGSLVQSRLRNSFGRVGALVGYILGLTSSRMPLNCKSSRTTWVKREACALAVSARGPKSATAMRGLLVSPRPVPARNQSCPSAVPALPSARATDAMKTPRDDNLKTSSIKLANKLRWRLSAALREIPDYIHAASGIVVGQRRKRV